MNRAHRQENTFAGLRSVDAAALISAAADVALLVDAEGTIMDVAIGSHESAGLGSTDWIGRPWVETVTVESRPKVEALLQGVGAPSAQKWRHVNHPSGQGNDVPVMYATLQAGQAGQILALGRDLRPLASIQQRLVAAQQSMERDYVRLRQVESRYRALFQSVSEAVLIADATSLKVVDANPAADRVFGDGTRRPVGRTLPECFDAGSRGALQAMLDAVRSARQAEVAVLQIAAGQPPVTVSASIFRQDTSTHLLLHVAPPAGTDRGDGEAATARRTVLAAVERAPDGLVVTDPGGRVLYANLSVAEMAQMDSPERMVGESLDRWLGRSGVDLGVLIANLRQNDSVRLFPTIVRGRFGAETTVEISAASVPDDAHPCLGFTIRDISRRLPTEGRGTHGLGRTVGQLTELVGRLPLKDIVGETTDMIEQLCIEAALQLTRDNRAAAAEMLGLSRQSLYVKLRRYGVGDLAAEG